MSENVREILFRVYQPINSKSHEPAAPGKLHGGLKICSRSFFYSKIARKNFCGLFSKAKLS